MTFRNWRIWAALSCAGGLGACGHDETAAVPDRVPDAAVTAVVADAATDEDAAVAVADADAGLPDVVFDMTGHVDANGEVLDCVYVRMPSDRGTIAVPSAESSFTPGSHHFLVFRTSYQDIPAGGDLVHACTDSEQITGVTGSYYEAQTPTAARALPPGVAHVFKPGEVLLMTAHYLNATPTGFDTSVHFRLHTEDVSLVQHEAGSIFFYNPSIRVPPFSQVTVTRTCPLDADVDLALLWSHMHSRGIQFAATSNDPMAAEQAGDLYDSTTWSEPSPRTFPYAPPVTLHSGSSITYSCTYRNTTAQTFVAGQSAATNEMCILHGMYWPRLDSSTEMCYGGASSMGSPIPLTGDGGVRSEASAP